MTIHYQDDPTSRLTACGIGRVEKMVTREIGIVSCKNCKRHIQRQHRLLAIAYDRLHHHVKGLGMTENTDPKAKQEFLTMIGHSLEVLEGGLISDVNRQSIRNGILEAISKLMDQRDAANASTEKAEADNKSLRDALERFAKLDLTSPISDAIAWDILNARAALKGGEK